MPETKNRTIEEIMNSWSRKKRVIEMNERQSDNGHSMEENESDKIVQWMKVLDTVLGLLRDVDKELYKLA